MQINAQSTIKFNDSKGKTRTAKLGDIWGLKGTKAATICHGNHNGTAVNSPVKVDLGAIGHNGMLAIFGDDKLEGQVPAIMSVSAFATLSTVGVKKYGSAVIPA